MKRSTAYGVMIPALAIGFLTVAASGGFAQDPRGGGAGGAAGGGGGQAGGGGAGQAGGGSHAASGGGQPSSGGGQPSGGGGSDFGGGSNSGFSGGSAIPRGSGVGFSGGSSTSASREARPRDPGYRRSSADDQISGRTRTGGGESSGGTSVPWYSRSRGGNPSTGTVANRGDIPVTNPPGGGGYYPGYPGYPGYGGGYGWGYGDNWYYNCYYYGYGCYGYPGGYYGGFGLGYFFYNPYGWSYGSGGYGDYGYGGGYGGGYSQQALGGIRLKVKPSTASVYVDGYFAGQVDDFDNAFQKLAIALGIHKIEISAPGYKPLIIEVNIRDWDVMTYEGRLEPIR